jgi:hypothetical protein
VGTAMTPNPSLEWTITHDADRVGRAFSTRPKAHTMTEQEMVQQLLSIKEAPVMVDCGKSALVVVCFWLCEHPLDGKPQLQHRAWTA